MFQEITINQNTIRLTEDDFLKIYLDAAPEIRKHAKEVDPYPEPLAIDYNVILKLGEDGSYKCYSARIGEEVIGYVGFYVYNHVHHSGVMIAAQDAIYVKPEYRNQGLGYALLKFSEEALKPLGVKYVQHAVTPCYDFSYLLERNGYKPLETVYFKNIKE